MSRAFVKEDGVGDVATLRTGRGEEELEVASIGYGISPGEATS